MLSRLNEFFQGWISVVIISIVSLTFLLWGVESYLHNGGRSQAVAKVAGVEISKDKLNRTFERARAQYEQASGKAIVDETQIHTLRSQALQAMIERQALQQDASATGIYISPQQAETSLFSLPLFQEEGHFSPERFERVLQSLQFTQSEFITDLQIDMSVNQMRLGLVMSAFATPKNMDDMIRLVEQKRDIEYLLVGAHKFPVTISPAEIKNYYDKHQAEFKTPEQVKIAYLSLSLEDLVKNTQVTENEVNQYYQNNSSNYVTPAKWRIAHINIKLPENPTLVQTNAAKEKAEQIAKKLKSGSDFATVAKSDSEDAITKKNGGELPELTKGMMDPSFEAVYSKLTKVGEISSPTQTKYGFEIVKLLAVTPEIKTPLDKLKDKITQNIKQEKAQKQFGDLREELANQTFSNPTTLEVASKTLKLPVKTSNYFSKLSPGVGITSNPQVLHAAFSEDVMNQGNNSDVIPVSETNMIVLRVLDHKPSATQNLAEVTKQIEQKLMLQAEIAATETFAKAMMSPKTTAAQAQTMLASHQLQWKSESGITRKNLTLPPPILEAAFGMAQKNASDTPFKIVKLTDGTAIVRLKQVADGVLKELTPQQRSALRDQFASSHGQLIYEVYKSGVLKHTKIDRFETTTAPSETD